LIRSLGGWAQVRAVRASGTRVRADPRIPGRGEFVERLVGFAGTLLTQWTYECSAIPMAFAMPEAAGRLC
jgi:hypothetical protein